ncbi:MAG: DUF2752 domain-containing protein [Proteobacteria bacterium]|nr:DUF2752 domain-containing protein [Pseudomonadota bacterium]
MISAALVLSIGVIFALSWWLDPSGAGHGTHTQLGLGQCTFLQLTGYACPMCGATTTFALMADLRPIAALINQPFAASLFALMVFVFVVAFSEVVYPRDRWGRIATFLAPWEGFLATAFLVFMGLGWLYKIAWMQWVG